MSARAPASAARTELARQLVAVLRGERALHEELLSLTAAERAAIASPSSLTTDAHQPLDQIVAEKEQVVARLTQLEQHRASLSSALASACGLPATARLVDLLPHLAPSTASILRAERSALLRQAQALAEANAANQALLTAALATTRATLGYLRSLQSHAYHSDGRAAGGPAPPGRLDRLV